jgi:hypothetical protein
MFSPRGEKFSTFGAGYSIIYEKGLNFDERKMIP